MDAAQTTQYLGLFDRQTAAIEKHAAGVGPASENMRNQNAALIRQAEALEKMAPLPVTRRQEFVYLLGCALQSAGPESTPTGLATFVDNCMVAMEKKLALYPAA